MLVEGSGRDVGGVGSDAEGEVVLGLPRGDGFYEEEAVFKGGMTNASDAFVGEGRFDRAGKADAVGPVGLEFGGGDGGTRAIFRQTTSAGAWMRISLETVRN